MNEIEKKKKSVELMRVTAAKSDMEIRIMEYNEEIKRLNENIIIQDKKISELEKLLQGA